MFAACSVLIRQIFLPGQSSWGLFLARLGPVRVWDSPQEAPRKDLRSQQSNSSELLFWRDAGLSSSLSFGGGLLAEVMLLSAKRLKCPFLHESCKCSTTHLGPPGRQRAWRALSQVCEDSALKVSVIYTDLKLFSLVPWCCSRRASNTSESQRQTSLFTCPSFWGCWPFWVLFALLRDAVLCSQEGAYARSGKPSPQDGETDASAASHGLPE